MSTVADLASRHRPRRSWAPGTSLLTRHEVALQRSAWASRPRAPGRPRRRCSLPPDLPARSGSQRAPAPAGRPGPAADPTAGRGSPAWPSASRRTRPPCRSPARTDRGWRPSPAGTGPGSARWPGPGPPPPARTPAAGARLQGVGLELGASSRNSTPWCACEIAPGRTALLPPPMMAAWVALWCGATNGGRPSTSSSAAVTPSSERTARTSIDCSRVSRGRIETRRSASIVLPEPGGPAGTGGDRRPRPAPALSWPPPGRRRRRGPAGRPDHRLRDRRVRHTQAQVSEPPE